MPLDRSVGSSSLNSYRALNALLCAPPGQLWRYAVMSTYHRYLIADGSNASLGELRQCLRDCDPSYDIDGDVVTFDGAERGIIIDITERGDPIFDDDIDLLGRQADNDPAGDEIHRRLDRSTCMVTMLVTSTCDEVGLDALWEWLRVHKKGILAYEGGTFRIDK
jgi:hypothetical protein